MRDIQSEKYHCCATCIHFRSVKSDKGLMYKCARLGYETKPTHKFNCWEPKEQVKALMEKRK